NGLFTGGNSYPGTISGSTLSFTGGSTLAGNLGTLNGVTIPAGSDVRITPSSQPNDQNNQTLTGTITNNGLIELTASRGNALLNYYRRTATLTGTGPLQTDPAVNGHAVTVHYAGNSATLTNAAGHTIDCLGSGTISAAQTDSAVVNKGVLKADGGSLDVYS